MWIRRLRQASREAPRLLLLYGSAILWLQVTLTSFRTEARIVRDAFMGRAWTGTHWFYPSPTIWSPGPTKGPTTGQPRKYCREEIDWVATQQNLTLSEYVEKSVLPHSLGKWWKIPSLSCVSLGETHLSEINVFLCMCSMKVSVGNTNLTMS